MKKLSLILLLSLGAQSSLFGSEEATSYNPITDYCSSLKDEIVKRMPNMPSFMKKEEVVIPKTLSLKDKIVTTTLNGTSFIKDKTTSFANNSSAFIKDNQKASIACGVALVTGAAYLAYRNYKAKKTAKQIL